MGLITYFLPLFAMLAHSLITLHLGYTTFTFTHLIRYTGHFTAHTQLRRLVILGETYHTGTSKSLTLILTGLGNHRVTISIELLEHRIHLHKSFLVLLILSLFGLPGTIFGLSSSFTL